MRSKRESSVGARLMLSTTERFGSYFEQIGFADASTDVRAFREQMMPALATETVCCSIVSRSTALGALRRPRALSLGYR